MSEGKTQPLFELPYEYQEMANGRFGLFVYQRHDGRLYFVEKLDVGSTTPTVDISAALNDALDNAVARGRLPLTFCYKAYHLLESPFSLSMSHLVEGSYRFVDLVDPLD